jgi:hypothetical protein
MSAVHATSTIPRWPALQGAGADTVVLRCRSGTWGKTPGTQLDYRWIARSAGFSDGCSALSGALRAGSEERAVSGHLWRRLPDRYVAVAVAPGRVRDGAGRLVVIEKQVLELRAEPALPAALAALGLLPAVPGTPPDAVATDPDAQAAGQPGAAERVLELPAPADVVLERSAVVRAIAAGCAELAALVSAADLRACFATLLSGRCPAPLRARGSLSPRAVAALLLPLPRAWADRLSIAGVVADATPAPYDLRRNWDLVVTDVDLAGIDDHAPEAAVVELAERCAWALCSGDPACLADGVAARLG